MLTQTIKLFSAPLAPRYSTCMSLLNYVPYLLTCPRAFVSYVLTGLMSFTCLRAFVHANVPICVHVLRSCVCRWFTCLCTFIKLCAYTWQLCAFERQDTKIHLENMVSVSMLVRSEDEIINTDCHFYLLYQNSMNLIPRCKSTSNLLKVCI